MDNMAGVFLSAFYERICDRPIDVKLAERNLDMDGSCISFSWGSLQIGNQNIAQRRDRTRGTYLCGGGYYRVRIDDIFHYRPVWLSLADHIQAHFLTCFIALVIVRLIEKRLKGKYSFKQVINSLRNYTSTHVEHDIYLQSFTDDVIHELEKEFNIDLSRKYLTLSEIKKILKELEN